MRSDSIRLDLDALGQVNRFRLSQMLITLDLDQIKLDLDQIAQISLDQIRQIDLIQIR